MKNSLNLGKNLRKNILTGFIYKIYCDQHDRFYIGKTNNPESRWSRHLSSLRRNVHENKELQNCYNKYGEQSFHFEILEKRDNITNEELSLLEIDYIKRFDNYFNGMNETTGGDGRGRIVSEEERKKMSERILGEKNPMYGRCGATNPNSRLADEEVKMIYVYLNSQYNGEYTQQGIADYFGVSRDTIKRIRSLEQHKYLKDFDLQSEEAKLLLDNFLEIFKGQPQAKSKCNRLRKV